ncbi:MAG: cytochrome b/b6 domain-containing protein, partial [Candidatus Igneacidithiobacillus chanchocoensis]
IHGLGLVLVSWMALTGTAIFFFLPQGGTPPGAILHALIPLHKALYLLVWAYWIGHVTLTLLHALRRDGIWRIFRLLD